MSILAADLRAIRHRLGCFGFYLVTGVAVIIATVVVTVFALFVADLARY